MSALTWSGCRNVRDLGGLPTADGGSVRPRALVRADSLTQLDEDGVAAVRAYVVSRIIDLRAGAGDGSPPHPFADDDTYRSVPWIDVDREPERDPAAERDLADLYRGSLDRNVVRVGAAVRAFTEAPPGPVVVHCAAGKDRTGMLVAVLLELAGVPREAVLADYALSADLLGIAEILDTLDEDTRRQAERYSWSEPETLQSALEHLDAVYGGARGYLRDACGLSDAELDAARDRLVG
jgi:protein tyrosine/serine phosphatase